MQTINKLILLVLIGAALVVWWTRERSSAEYDRQVGALASALDRRYMGPEIPTTQSESMFLRALVILADYRQLVTGGRIATEENTYLNDSLAAAGYQQPAEMTLVARALQANLTRCEQMKILGTPEGTQSLLSGQPPRIPTGPFKGDTLIIGRRVPPALAPDLANHPGNFELTPSYAAALIWPLALTNATLRTVDEFKRVGILEASIADELKLRAESLK